jgi:1-acyl-sn-glycerol-3-phosphate acyltransferase
VQQLAALMRSEPWFWLALSPEGTRRHLDHLRSGFYHLALEMNVPVGLAFIDYRTRHIGVRDYAMMSGDESRDLAMLHAYYVEMRGRYPALASTIAFRTTPAAAKGRAAP